MAKILIGFKNGQEKSMQIADADSVTALTDTFAGIQATAEEGTIKTKSKAPEVFKLGKAFLRLNDISYILPE